MVSRHAYADRSLESCSMINLGRTAAPVMKTTDPKEIVSKRLLWVLGVANWIDTFCPIRLDSTFAYVRFRIPEIKLSAITGIFKWTNMKLWCMSTFGARQQLHRNES